MRSGTVWILCGLLFATSSPAATLHVAPETLYPTIQAGIDSASAGDTLVISAGTWEENPLIVRKDLVLIGAAGEQVVLDASPGSNRNNSGCVLRTVSSRVLLRNLTLRNGRAPVGAAVFMFGGTLDVRNCRIEDNLYGILGVSGLINLIIVEDCELLRNVVGVQGSSATRIRRTLLQGGRLAFQPIGQFELEDVEVRQFGWPGTTRAGALDLSGSRGSLTRVLVEDNWSDGGRAGIWMSGGNFRLTDVTVRGNTSVNGPAGIGMDLVPSATLVRCTIEDNRASGEVEHGIAGLLVRRSNATADGCSIARNHSEDGGGGVSVQVESNLRLTNSSVMHNSSGNRGGGLYVSQGAATLAGVTVAGNSAPLGGGIMVETSGVLVADQITVAANTAQLGGGIFHMGLTSTVRRSIIAWHDGLDGVFCNTSMTLECVAIHGNGQDAVCGTDGGDNLSEDPLFCSLDAGGTIDLHLQQASPLLDVSGCGRLGALPGGCVQTSVLPTSWSTLKNLYR